MLLFSFNKAKLHFSKCSFIYFSCLHTFILTMCSFALQYFNYYYTSLLKFSDL